MGEVSNQPSKANIHTSVWNVAELTLICDEKWHFFDKPELFTIHADVSSGVKMVLNLSWTDRQREACHSTDVAEENNTKQSHRKVPLVSTHIKKKFELAFVFY